MFTESQSFVTKWLIILFLIILSIECYTIYTRYMTLGSFDLKASFWIIMIVFSSLFLIRLRVVVDDQGITIKFFPFVFTKRWLWDEIQTVKVQEYSFLDYGGWGYRFSTNGIAYTTKGKYGIQIVLKNGKRRLIGTQKPIEVEKVISNYTSKIDAK